MQLLLREFLLAAPSPKQWLLLEVLLEVSRRVLLGHVIWEQAWEGTGSVRVRYVQGDLRADLLQELA